MKAKTIFWFRRDLRLEDNHGLYQALKQSHPVIPLFIFDINILQKIDNKEDPRVEFIYNEIHKINQLLESKNSSLLVKIGDPEKVFTQLIKDHHISSVYTNHDYEPYAIERDLKIQNLLTSNEISFNTYKDHVIFEKDEILNLSGSPYKVYTPYKRRWKENLKENKIKIYPSEKENNYSQESHPTPSLKEIGFKKTSTPIPSHAIKKDLVKDYDQSRDIPSLDSTTKIGIHLRFGTISIRKAAKIALELNEVWLNELIWREFFIQLLYHFPDVENHSFNRKFKNMPWRYDEDDFQKWCEGKTGYPLVDAGMRELNQTGFMHNRVRMVCASFLTKHLLIDWRLGEKYFADKLLDYELASNNGNWQWSAGTGADAQPFFRIFNPTLQQKRFDPEFIYIKKWIPEFNTPSYPKPMVDHKKAVERAKKTFNVIK